MKYVIPFFLLIAFSSCNSSKKQNTDADSTGKERPAYAIVIHGGAGTILKKDLTPEMELAYQNSLDTALTIGESILKEGGTSLSAVEATIKYMENNPLYNAGKGAVFANNGTNELDASIMDGATQMAGAIGGVTNVKNPITGAIAVMQKSEHVMMVGRGAEEFCKLAGCEIVDPSYFYTERRWQALLKAKAKDTTNLDTNDPFEKKKGTVGCVALDKNGNIVAGTSTGGMTNKKYNRIGDAPIIGAGTFADNKSCGVSSTGHGEFFIRYTVARDIAALMEYGGKSLEEASEYIINKKLKEKGGEGGIVALDAMGNIVMKFNSEGMYRGYAKPGKKEIAIYKQN
jgi:L-asparaginase / beta-aspartyl-peptidase